jgi:hypothetical protein
MLSAHILAAQSQKILQATERYQRELSKHSLIGINQHHDLLSDTFQLTLISWVMPILRTSLRSSGDPRSSTVWDGIGAFSASCVQSGWYVAPLGAGGGRERAVELLAFGAESKFGFLPSSGSARKLSPLKTTGLRRLRFLDSTTSTLEAVWMESSYIVSVTREAGIPEGQNVLLQISQVVQ